ncbi:MAG TPA: hypothetical protein PK252_11210 [Bacteroidales bacterium]|nr:hypothetical protein [Bacteroidales bacterium]
MNKTLKALLCLVFFISVSAKAQQESAGARLMAMGNCGTAVYDHWSSAYNQAGVAFAEKANVNTFYQRRFNIKELSTSAFSAIMPTRLINIATDLKYFGYSKYNKTLCGVSFARLFGQRFAAGLRCSYLQEHIEGNSNKNRLFNLDCGVMANLQPFVIGCKVQNIIPPDTYEYKYPEYETNGAVGVAWQPLSLFIFSAEIESSLKSKILYRSGLEYTAWQILQLRTGIIKQNDQHAFTFGIGLLLKRFHVDIAMSKYQYLPFSQAFEAGVSF